MTLTYFFLPLSLTPFLLPVWLELTIIGGVLGMLTIFFLVKFNQLKDQKMELQRQLIEKAELLFFAAERERKAVEKAEEINQTKKVFLSRINHEIRTPMNGVMGMVSLLAETTLSPEQKEYNETIKNCGESLLTVIHDILLGDVLAHAKVESTVAELEHKEFDLRNSIEEIFDVFASQAALKDIELVYQVDHRIPTHLIGDKTRLSQVLMNLVENSVKFTKQGEIFIKVGLKTHDMDVIDLGFEVKDTGEGISSEDLRFITHSITEPGAHRAGIGLFLCNRLMGIMGGTLTIDSRVNEGTTIRCDLKLNTGSVIQRVHHDMLGVEGKRILLVEDNPTLRNVLQEKLQHWKLNPTIADTGAQALEILSEKSNFDLVLAEMQMPVMNGVELSRSIRKLYPTLPIILISAAHDEGSKQNHELFSSLVNKPIRHSILSQHILSALIHKDEGSVSEQAIVKQKLSVEFSAKYPLRILIAEDNPVNQKLAMKVLGKLGYKPDVAKNGKEVLEEVSKVNYDLILMDVQMPEMDGLEATRMIRLCLALQPVIVAMTANAMQGDREECINAGMEDYISKPVHIEELVIMLEKWALQIQTKAVKN